MEKFAVDYEEVLQKSMDKKTIYRWSEVKSKPHIKVAFDVVRFTDTNDNIDGLWQIKHSDEGDYIMAMYDVDPNEKTSSNWSVVLDKRAENINVFYKNTPLTKIAVSKLGIPAQEVDFVCGFLPQSLEKNASLKSSLLTSLPIETKQNIKKSYPELSEFFKSAQPVQQTTILFPSHPFYIEIPGKSSGYLENLIETMLKRLNLIKNKHFKISTNKNNPNAVQVTMLVGKIPSSFDASIIERNLKAALFDKSKGHYSINTQV